MKIKRPFAVRYNPYNQSIEILSSAQQVSNIVCDLKGDICIIFNALKKMEKIEEKRENNESENGQENEVYEKGSSNEHVNEIDRELKKQQNQKLIRNFKRLEEAFRNLSIDFHDE